MLNKEKLNSLQFASLIVFPLLSIFVNISFNNLKIISGIDSYVSIVMSFFGGLILLFQFIYVFNYKEELSIIEKNRYLFGNFWGNFFNFLLLIIAFIISCSLVFSMSSFIMAYYLSETPIYFLLLLMGLAIVYGVSKGIVVISRGSFVIFITFMLFNLVSNISLINNFDINNISPFLEYGLSRPLYGSFSFIINTFVPIFFLLIIPKNSIVDKNNICKNLVIFYLISIIILFFICFLTSGVLGINLLKLFLHPEYNVLKKVSVFSFIDRVENIFYLKWLFSNYIVIVLFVYYISRCVRNVEKQFFIPCIVIIIILLFSQLLFNNIIDFKYFVSYIYLYCNLLLLLIMEIIFMGIVIKK